MKHILMPTIIIPTYNERENIAKLIEQIFSLSIPGMQIIIVDDNSPDGTAKIVKELANKYPIYIIERKEKLGLGSAYIAGFKKALSLGADTIFEMDADLSHNPNDLKTMLQEINKGADLVIGSRRVKGGKIIGWNAIRKGMSMGAMLFSRILLRLKTKDVTSGFRCFRKNVLENIDLSSIKSNGYAFQEEMLYQTEQLGFKVKEIPVTFIDRAVGSSKLSKKDIIEFFIVMIKLKIQKKPKRAQ